MTNKTNSLGFSLNTSALVFPHMAREPKKPSFMLHKLMPQYVHDLTYFECNPFTFVEVQTLIDGITIGGHRLFDQMQVLNQHKSLLFLLETLANPNHEVGDQLACAFHKRIAKEEALQWGVFRNGQVTISDTKYQPPGAEELSCLYRDGIKEINAIAHPVERALTYFFWGALRQFFYDGNKRCARVMMNYILMSNGYYYLSMPCDKRDEFYQMMVDFYDTRNATAGIQWLLGCYTSWD